MCFSSPSVFVSFGHQGNVPLSEWTHLACQANEEFAKITQLAFFSSSSNWSTMTTTQTTLKSSYQKSTVQHFIKHMFVLEMAFHRPHSTKLLNSRPIVSLRVPLFIPQQTHWKVEIWFSFRCCFDETTKPYRSLHFYVKWTPSIFGWKIYGAGVCNRTTAD